MTAHLLDRSGNRYPIDRPRWRGDDGGPLAMSELPGITAAEVDTSLRSHWRYAAALPPGLTERITLGEGCTPLLPTRVHGHRVLAKAEWFNPTASFKDRGSSVMVSALASQGVPEMLEDSSGNGGSSVAAYAAAAGIRARILAPESTSAAKILQSRLHGARVDLVPGDRSATSDEAIRRSGDTFYSSHNWNPYFLQGTKLLAYEIWEDLGFTAPDAVVIPCGAGSLVLGLSIGFGELLRTGAIGTMPRLLAAQPANCAPLAGAFELGAAAAAAGTWLPTVAEGTAIARPVRDREVLAAVRSSGGAMVSVSEEAITGALRQLHGQGLYAEPTSAVPAAALGAFAERGLLEGTVVLVLSGSGLKAAEKLAALLR